MSAPRVNYHSHWPETWSPWRVRGSFPAMKIPTALPTELGGDLASASAKSFRDVSNAGENRREDTACLEIGFPRAEKELARKV